MTRLGGNFGKSWGIFKASLDTPPLCTLINQPYDKKNPTLYFPSAYVLRLDESQLHPALPLEISPGIKDKEKN